MLRSLPLLLILAPLCVAETPDPDPHPYPASPTIYRFNRFPYWGIDKREADDFVSYWEGAVGNIQSPTYHAKHTGFVDTKNWYFVRAQEDIDRIQEVLDQWGNDVDLHLTTRLRKVQSRYAAEIKRMQRTRGRSQPDT